MRGVFIRAKTKAWLDSQTKVLCQQERNTKKVPQRKGRRLTKIEEDYWVRENARNENGHISQLFHSSTNREGDPPPNKNS